MPGTYIQRAGQERNAPLQVMSADGAVVIKEGIAHITKGSACAMTLAAPNPGPANAGGDDGKILWVFAATAFAHTLTISGGLRGAGAGADVGTFGLAVANGIGLYAYNGAWYDLPGTNVGVTFA
jgi:hypothetical protein